MRLVPIAIAAGALLAPAAASAQYMYGQGYGGYRQPRYDDDRYHCQAIGCREWGRRGPPRHEPPRNCGRGGCYPPPNYGYGYGYGSGYGYGGAPWHPQYGYGYGAAYPGYGYGHSSYGYGYPGYGYVYPGYGYNGASVNIGGRTRVDDNTWLYGNINIGGYPYYRGW